MLLYTYGHFIWPNSSARAQPPPWEDRSESGVNTNEWICLGSVVQAAAGVMMRGTFSWPTLGHSVADEHHLKAALILGVDAEASVPVGPQWTFF